MLIGEKERRRFPPSREELLPFGFFGALGNHLYAGRGSLALGDCRIVSSDCDGQAGEEDGKSLPNINRDLGSAAQETHFENSEEGDQKAVNSWVPGRACRRRTRPNLPGSSVITPARTRPQSPLRLLNLPGPSRRHCRTKIANAIPRRSILIIRSFQTEKIIPRVLY